MRPAQRGSTAAPAHDASVARVVCTPKRALIVSCRSYGMRLIHRLPGSCATRPAERESVSRTSASDLTPHGFALREPKRRSLQPCHDVLDGLRMDRAEEFAGEVAEVGR